MVQEYILGLQRTAGNRAVGKLLLRKCAECDEEEEQLHRKPAEATAEANTAAEEPEAAVAAPMIVDDDVAELQPGQMKKSDFLAELRPAVCEAAEEALRGTLWSAAGCPWIDRWFDYYVDQDAAHVERAIRRYATAAGAARSAADYIPAVAARVQRGIREWSETGEVADLPPELQEQGAPGASVAGLLGAGVAAVGRAVAGAVTGAARAVAGIFTKSRPGSAAPVSESPESVERRLGTGETLEPGLRNRMESAFGAGFGNVRVHRDDVAAETSASLSARAFAVGDHVAFAQGEYQPGTPVGDALIAHELAHVVQAGGSGAGGALTKGGGGEDRLEEDADTAAVGAVARLWEGARDTITEAGRNALPRLRSGLKLQRCSSPRTTPVTQREADVFILGAYPEARGRQRAGVSAQGAEFHFVGEAEFAIAFHNMREYLIEQGKNPGPDRPQDLVGFVDPQPTTPPRVWICTPRQKADTVLHEAVHLFGHPDWFRAIGTGAMVEGSAEYFTRRLAERNNIAISGVYECYFHAFRDIVEITNEEVLRRAYFAGEVNALQAAVDRRRSPGTFNDWVAAVSFFSFGRARELLGLGRDEQCD
jgi:hypothetical protein